MPNNNIQRNDIRLIALDLDGTVFDDNKKITPRTLAAIRAALDKGVIVLPATGRTLDGVPEVFLNMPGVRYALTSNGATVSDMHTRERLVNLPFQLEEALGIYDILVRYAGLMAVFIDGHAYSPAGEEALIDQIVMPALRPYVRKSRLIVEDLRATMLAHADSIEKFSIMYADEATRDEVWRVATEAYHVEPATSIPKNLELNAAGVTKGSALRTLTERLGLRPENVMACGDGGNDTAMLEYAGLGVAMTNAEPDVKQVAQYITADNNHDGVAEAIEKFVLC